MFDDSRNYERFMGRWSRRLAPQVIGFAGVGPGQHVLDVGTGTGALAAALVADHAPAAITAIDPSPAYVAHAAAACRDPRLRFEVGDGQAMRFDDDSFDRCLSMLALNFVPEPARAAREMRRVTRPGGVAVAAVWDYADGMRMLRAFWDAAVDLDPRAAPRDERRLPCCTPGELERLFGDAGFAAVETAALVVEQEFGSFADYWEPFLLGTGPAGGYVAGLERGRVDSLRAAVLERVLGARPDGPFVMRARAWCVRGTKARAAARA